MSGSFHHSDWEAVQPPQRSQPGLTVAASKAGLNADGVERLTTHDLRRTFISHVVVGLGLAPVWVARIAGHSHVSVTLDINAEGFDRTLHRDDLDMRIEKAGFGAVAQDC